MARRILAYMLLWLATLWGVFISNKMVKGWIDGTLLYDMHEFLPILAVVFAVLHAAVLLGDAYIGFSVLDLLVPFAPLIARFGRVRLTGALSQRRPHRQLLHAVKDWPACLAALSLLRPTLAFILALAHGIQAGTDSSQPMVMGMYVATGASSALLPPSTASLTVKGSRKPTTPIATRRRPAAASARRRCYNAGSAGRIGDQRAEQDTAPSGMGAWQPPQMRMSPWSRPRFCWRTTTRCRRLRHPTGARGALPCSLPAMAWTLEIMVARRPTLCCST